MAKAGGLLEGRRIADLGDLYYMPLAPHNICGPVGTVAVSHVCAATRNFLALEFHHLDNELWNTLTVEDDLIREGHLALPTTPGLGVDLDEDVARAATREEVGRFFD